MKFFFSLAAVLAFACGALLLGPPPAQTSSSVAASGPLASEPLRVSKIQLQTNDTRSAAGRTRGLAVEVENTSGKAVRFLEIKLDVRPAQPDAAAPPQLSLRYGQVAASAAGTEQSSPLAPGAKLTLRPSAESFAQDSPRRHRHGYAPSPADEVTARVGVVIFADGTSWARGRLHYPDPANPLRWNVAPSAARAEAAGLDGAVRFTAAKYGFNASFGAVRPQSGCGAYAGYEVYYCCDDNYIVFSDIVNEGDPSGNVMAVLEYAQCPYSYGGGTCPIYRARPCR